MSAKRMFAVDFGASGGKCFAGVIDNGAFSMHEVHRFSHEGTSFFMPDASGNLTERTYWDDVLLYKNIVDGLHAYRRTVSDHLDSIGIDTWGADGQFISTDGDILGKVYCYRDHRLDNMIAVVKSKVDAKRMYELTGIHFQPFNLSNQLHWYVTNRAKLMKQADTFLPVPTLFYYYLGGGKQVDSTWASITQLMDARKRKWSSELLKALQIPKKLMPEIVAPGTRVGELRAPIAAAVGLNQASLIAVAAHDTASAFAAAPIKNAAEALIISSGTWSIVGKLVKKPITSDLAMSYNISNEGGIGNVRLLKNCMGTWIVQELRRAWRSADGAEMGWPELNEQTELAPAFAAMIDPDDPGFYNPANMEAAIIEFCRKTHQTPPATRGGFARVVYESLAMKYRLVNEQICQVSGTDSKVIHIVGGGCRNKMLNQFTADALGLPVLAGPEEATAVGNLMVQALGLGLVKNLREAMPMIKKAFPIPTYTPNSSEAWQKAYDKFKTLVK